MPVINGVYTKDFPALGRAPIDTDIIPIAELANQITYKTTIGAIFNAKVFGTTGRLSKFIGANTLGNSILNEIGNAIHLTNGGLSYASFGIINPGTPGDPGIDNDAYIGSTINNDFTIRVNNTEAARFDTALRFKIANIQNATSDTDKFLVSDGGVVKYRTGTELRSDIGAGVGSVTSVGLTMPVAFSVANSPITSAGTLEVTAIGSASQYIRGDGTLATIPSTSSGGANVNYYLNGSVAASVATYKQMDNSAVIGGGTDFNLTGNGLIAQFLTDAGNPNRLLIPGGAWNFEMYFNVSSSGGNSKFYVELLKYDGTTFTSIASSSAVPEEITGGTTTDLYITSLAVPETVLLITDRLALRVYIVDNSGGRTVTLHTEDNTLCLVTTTFAGGIAALNGLTANTQYFAVGTTGTDFNISSVLDTHTFNLPNASATVRGVITTGTQTFAGQKTFTDAVILNSSLNLTSGALSIIYNPANTAYWQTYVDSSNVFNFGFNGANVKASISSGGNITGASFIKSGGTSSQFLKADGSVDSTAYGTGSVTSVAALTLGTSGTDLNSSVANGTTTPVITLNVPDASASNRGVITTGTQTIAGAKTFTGALGGTSAVFSSTISAVGGSGTGITGTTTNGTALRGTATNGGEGLFASSYSGVGANIISTLNKAAQFTSAGSSTTIGVTNNSTGDIATFSNSGGTVFSIKNGGTLSNGTYTYTLPSATGTLALTSQLHDAVTLSAIGSTPNANGATLTGQVLNLQPADASFGGVVTTGTQTIAGAKTFSSDIAVNGAIFGTRSKNQSLFAGVSAGLNVSSGVSNTFIGDNSGTNATTGSSNTLIGRTAGTAQTTADLNTLIGQSAGVSLTTGGSNTFLGSDAGSGITTGSGNTIIGAQVTGLSSTLTNNIILANGTGAIKARHDGTNWTFTGGATLTGALSGTSATFSGDTIALSGRFNSGNYSLFAGHKGDSKVTIASEYIGDANQVSLPISFKVSNVSQGRFEAMQINPSGNLGLGVTPSAWGSTYLGFQIGSGSAIGGRTDGLPITLYMSNTYLDSSVVSRYIVNKPALRYVQDANGGSHWWDVAPSGTAGNAISFTQAMTLTAGGNLGIGTTSPSTALTGTNLTINSSSGGYSSLILKYDGTDRGFLTSTSTQTILGTLTSGTFLQFNTEGSEAMRITSGGNVLIGTTTDAGYKLDVNGTGRFSGALVGTSATFSDGITITKETAATNTRIVVAQLGRATSGTAAAGIGGYLQFLSEDAAGTQREAAVISWDFSNASSATPEGRLYLGTRGANDALTILNTGAVTLSNLAGTGSRAVLADANGLLSAPVSDISVKENIKSIGYGLNEIVKMNPVWFDFVDDYKNFGEGRQNGNIAQEMKEIIPEAVFTTPSTGKMGINYDQLHAVYIKAIQELTERIKQLENK